MPIILSGSEEIKQKYLPRIARGETMICYALTEAGAGSDAAAMKMRAVKDGDHYILDGTKMFISNAGVSKIYTVMAVTDPDKRGSGISAFVVEDDDPGFQVGKHEEKMGIRGSPTCELIFENCRIPADRLIGNEGEGFKTALRTLDHTRLTIGAQAVGIAQGALDACIPYVKERVQFGKPIASLQAIQFMLADMSMQIEAARNLVYLAAGKAERHDPDLTRFSCTAKCFASDTAMHVTTDAVQVFGGYGYVREYPVERMMRDAKITQIYEGTNQIQRVVIARQILS
jgi:alkylation response protein AidB-like acyl-CoA dehydrogenase